MAHPFRYTFIVGLVALGTGLAAFGGWRYARASAPVNGPIILISIDTLRADHLPAYGYSKVRTPAIDELAANGVVFERAYSHTPQTLAAHVSLLTGRLPFETGVRDNVGFIVKPTERLLAEMLRDRGYATAAIVSSYTLRKETGISRGFELFDAEMDPADPEREVGGLRRDGAESERRAEQWLDQANTSRALLFLHLYEPHKPYAPPKAYAEYAPYDAEIAYADEIVGRLLRYLKGHQLYDRSTIILLSDHGEGLGDHGEREHGLLVYDEVIHVPLIIKQAANEGRGRRVATLVQHVDVLPTILDLAKAPIPGNIQGRSLRPLLDGNTQFPERLAYSESLYGRYRFGWSELASVTDGRSQYIKAPRPEFFDVAADSAERHPIAIDGNIRAETMRAELDRLLKRAKLEFPAALEASDWERFDALGYVGQPSREANPDAPLPDPKDMAAALDKYRAAVDLMTRRRWTEGLTALRQLGRQSPEMMDVWRLIGSTALRVGRYEEAVSAYKKVSGLDSTDARARIGAGEALLRLKRLDEAKLEATLALDAEPSARAAGHELLARIALARRDADAVRAEAAMTHEADNRLPMSSYFEGRLLYDQARYDDALGAFQQTIENLARGKGPAILDLHYFTAESLRHLDRSDESEAELQEELRSFPQNARAWTALATLYRAMGRTDEAEQALSEMVRVNPTSEGYAAAGRLWTSFGDRRKAAALKAEAVRQGL